MLKPVELSGLVSAATGRNLARLAKGVPADQAIVEIGTFRGKSACCLASQAEAHVWTVDPWDLPGNEGGKHGFSDPSVAEDFARQVAATGLEDRITHLQMFSPAAAAEWSRPGIGMLFIDGDHREQSVLNDFAAWSPHLVDGAVVALDDVDTPNNPGVRAAVEQLDLTDLRVLKDNLAVGVWSC